MGTIPPGIRIWHALQRAVKGAGGLAKAVRTPEREAERGPPDDLFERFTRGVSLSSRHGSPEMLLQFDCESELRCDECDREEERGRAERLEHQRDQENSTISR